MSDSTVNSNIKKQEYIDKANLAEKKYGLPANLLVGLIGAESGFNPNAVSPAGAVGLTQFMPATAREFGIDPRNADQSIDAAGKYLSQNYKKLGNWEDTLRSYNMGLGNVNKWKRGEMKLPKETAAYVDRVYSHMDGSGGSSATPQSIEQTRQRFLDTWVLPTQHDMRPNSEGNPITSAIPVAEEDPEVAAAKQDIAKAETDKQVMNDYFSQPNQQQQQQTYEQGQEAAPSIMEQYGQVSQFVDTPLSQEGGMPCLECGGQVMQEGGLTERQKQTLARKEAIAAAKNIPVSSQGVYDYPMQEVIVPTDNGNITMENVDYPILGTDELGNSQMMQPGQEYQFPGKIIHEVPQLKNYFNKR